MLKAALPQGGKIILLVGYPSAQNARERIEGITNGLAGSSILIIDTLAGMVVFYSYDRPAILTAVRGAGKAGQGKIACFDADSDTLAGIAAGDIYGTIVQKPFSIGRETIFRIGEYLRGDKTQLAGGKLFITSHAVTKDNVAAYQAPLKALLRPGEWDPRRAGDPAQSCRLRAVVVLNRPA